MKLFDELGKTQAMVDYQLARHSVLVSNLSHSETPGYTPKDLAFNQALQSAGTVSRSHTKHLQSPGGGDSSYELVEAPGVRRRDGNGVQLEKAMAKVSANKIKFEAGIEILRRRLAILRYAATDGGR